MNKRAFKDTIYEELARITKALANPHRLEIIDLLVQGPFSVEQIAGFTGMPIANASQHLQALKKANLVKVTRNGNFINYTLAGENIFETWCGLRKLGQVYNLQVDKLIEGFRKGLGGIESVDAESLLRMLEKEEVILLDVRPEEEFNRGHIHRALSMPVQELGKNLKKLPKGKTIVAYCRGPFCVYADEAVALLLKKGYSAMRLDEGYPEWAMKGLPVI